MSQKFLNGFLKRKYVIIAGLPIYRPLRLCQYEEQFTMGSRPEYTGVANLLRINTDEQHTHASGSGFGGKECRPLCVHDVFFAQSVSRP